MLIPIIKVKKIMHKDIKTITRASLAEEVYREIGISYSESLNLVDLFFDEITDMIIKNGCIKISSFGSFYTKQKKDRIGRNPQTKVEFPIKARKIVRFYTSKILKNQLNQKDLYDINAK